MVPAMHAWTSDIVMVWCLLKLAWASFVVLNLVWASDVKLAWMSDVKLAWMLDVVLFGVNVDGSLDIPSWWTSDSGNNLIDLVLNLGNISLVLTSDLDISPCCWTSDFGNNIFDWTLVVDNSLP